MLVGGLLDGLRSACFVDGLVEDLSATFIDLVEAIGGEVVKSLMSTAGPADFDGGNDRGSACAKVGAEIALREVAGSADDFADLVDTGGGDFDSGAECIAVGFCADESEVHEMIFVQRVVMEERRRVAIVCDENIDGAVVVEIGERDSACGAAGKRVEAALGRYLAEFSLRFVVE